MLQATDEQITEAKAALDKAMALNPNDMQLLGFYAEYISDTEPLRALAIRQALQKIAPSLENAFLLGRMALKVADREIDQCTQRYIVCCCGFIFAAGAGLRTEKSGSA